MFLPGRRDHRNERPAHYGTAARKYWEKTSGHKSSNQNTAHMFESMIQGVDTRPKGHHEPRTCSSCIVELRRGEPSVRLRRGMSGTGAASA